MRLGDGSFQYEVVPNWEKLPDEYRWDEVGGVGVDSKDNVYVFNRGPHPMIVFDKDGNFLTSWGEDFFIRAHGLTVGPDDILYCTDDADHTVRKCTTEGEVLMTIGVPKTPSPYQSAKPFNRCTHVALDPETQDIYVSMDMEIQVSINLQQKVNIYFLGVVQVLIRGNLIFHIILLQIKMDWFMLLIEKT